MEEVEADNLAGGKIPILNPLAHVVFVHRLTEVAEIIRIDLGVKLRFFSLFRYLQLPRRGGQSHLHRLWVSREHL